MLAVQSVALKAGSHFLINGITHSFTPGVLYGILGPNGSGKTTLLKLLSGIWTPTSGQVFWGDRDLQTMQRQEISRLISLVPQSPAVPFDFTALEMVTMGRYPHGQSGKTPSEKILIREALRLVDAEELAGRKMSHLSVGERQRLYIARALVTESPVLLMDEPTASLDIRHEMEIWDILKKLLGQGKTIIAAIHNLFAADTYCDQVIALKEGRPKGTGETKRTLTPALLQEVYGVKSHPYKTTNY